jgi:diadenosine tetraphosphate (Ap4A) HIT family hydrolase
MGIIINESAVQTVLPVEIHLIPRCKNDVKNPKGDVRGVVSEKWNY